MRAATSSDLGAVDELRERGHATEEPGIQRQLAAVTFLVREPVLHPGKSGPLLSIEPSDELEDVQLPGLSELFFAGGMAGFEQLEEHALRRAPAHVARVLLDEPGKRLTGEVGVGSRQLARHHEARLDDVLNDFRDRACRWSRPEAKAS